MAKILLLNYVHIDGWGDFQHFLDIYSAMKKNDRMRNNEYISFLCPSIRPHNELEDKIKHYNSLQTSHSTQLQNYYIVPDDDETNFHEDAEVQKHFAECTQIIVISSIFKTFPNLENLLVYCKPGVLVKYIGEHEYNQTFTRDIRAIKTISGENIQNPITIYPMGLSKQKNARGIKLDAIPRTLNPWEILNKNDPNFFKILLDATKSADSDHFVQTNIFMLSYFNNISPFLYFLLLLAINDSLPQKDIALFFSGNPEQMMKDIRDVLDVKSRSFKFFIDSHVKEIQLIGEDSAQFIYPLNPNGTKIIRIFHGFYLSNQSFKAIYQTKPLVAAISGDNTLELTIANQVLPFYFSTNYSSKKHTNKALFDIAKELAVQDNKKELLSYLDPIKFDKFASFRNIDDLIKEFKQLNLIAAAQQWQDVAAYIIKYFNFYDVLETIFNDKLTKTEEKMEEDTNNNNTSPQKNQAQAIQMWNRSSNQIEDTSTNNDITLSR